MSSAPKSCELDSLPASLIQDYVDDLLPFLTLLCNRSLEEGVLPDSQKRSVVFPALKRDRLDLIDPSNFRPISNASFLSNIIEKIVSEQITSYLSTNDVLPKYQSGFRRGHSTETLLLRLLSDCYGAIDGRRVTLLALFDVSAAFDTVDHQILILSFIHSFGHFYSAPSSPLLLRGAPDHSTDTVSEFHAEAHRQLHVKDLPKVPTRRLERESNPRPFG